MSALPWQRLDVAEVLHVAVPDLDCFPGGSVPRMLDAVQPLNGHASDLLQQTGDLCRSCMYLQQVMKHQRGFDDVPGDCWSDVYLGVKHPPTCSKHPKRILHYATSTGQTIIKNLLAHWRPPARKGAEQVGPQREGCIPDEDVGKGPKMRRIWERSRSRKPHPVVEDGFSKRRP